MVPIGLIYSTPEDAAAEIKYLENRHHPIPTWRWEKSPTATTSSEDYAALYLQFSAAMHKVDPNLKLGSGEGNGRSRY
jgi:hypothetical protein